MKSKTLIILAIALALFGAAIAVGASLLHDGLSARATPSRWETRVARSVRHFAIPASAKTTPNPVLASVEDLRDARIHFADHCAICHANDGSGKTMVGEGLYPKPPDLRSAETQNLTDGELFWTIENGVRFTGMPAFSNGGEHGGMQDSWKLVHFIRHLPHLTAAERIEMERYNPKGPEDRAEEQQENEFLNGTTPQQKPESQDHRPE
ncbi:MAG TPA: cytochrome c [Candidatus Acidoferrum sp.]|nr:cytochrome c [Candidatus Acidoferrum sp.]